MAKPRARSPKRPSPQSAPENGPVMKAALFLGVVLMAVVVVFLVARAFQAAQDVAGERVVVIEKVGDITGVYVLNHTRTAEEAPALDRLLFMAFRSGKATSNDPATVAEVRDYLDMLAREEGYERFESPPFENVFRWGDDTFRVIYFDRSSTGP